MLPPTNEGGRRQHAVTETIKVLAEQRSARLPVTQETVGSNPIGDARQHGAVRKLAKRRSSNLRDCLWVRLPHVLLATEPAERLARIKAEGGREKREMRRLGIGEPKWL